MQDRIGIAALPVEAHHGTGHIDQDQRTARLFQFLHQFGLHGRQFHRCTVTTGKPAVTGSSGITGFAFVISADTTHENDNVCFLSLSSHLGKRRSAFEFLNNTDTCQRIDLNTVTKAFLQTLIRGNDFARRTKIVSQQRAAIIHIRTDQGDTFDLGGIQRQDILIILQ